MGQAPEVAGATTEIPGTIVFTGEQSQWGYRLNRMAMSLTVAASRQRFVADDVCYAHQMGLTGDEVDLVRRRDWRGMLAPGASIYLIIKMAGEDGGCGGCDPAAGWRA